MEVNIWHPTEKRDGVTWKSDCSGPHNWRDGGQSPRGDRISVCIKCRSILRERKE